MGVWSTTTPAGSDLLSQGDDKIREMKTAIQEALRAGEVAGDNIEGVEAIFPGASPSSAPVYRYRGLKDVTSNRPVAGQYGQFFDMTRNVLQRDNGTSWDDVGTVIPSGTKMVFYQASAPVGWTSVALNDKFLRVVTAGGTGGSTGGTVAASTSLAHTHTVASHTHPIADHSHQLDYESFSSTADYIYSNLYTLGSDGDNANFITLTGASSSTNKRKRKSGTTMAGVVVTGSGGDGNSSETFTGAFAYADIIVCSKD